MRVTQSFTLLAAAATLAVATTAAQAAPVFINVLTGGTSGFIIRSGLPFHKSTVNQYLA